MSLTLLVQPPRQTSAMTAITAISADSRIELRFNLSDGVSRLSIPRQDPPWRAIRAFHNPQNQALVHLHNVSGGVLSGDSLELSVHAGPGTNVQVTSVGATRIYRRRSGSGAARLRTFLQVEPGAMLEHLPEPVIPFADSALTQCTTVSLADNAGFIGWETLAAGRVASGEEFRFDCLKSEYSIRSGSRLLALERYSLVPREQDARAVGRFGRFRYSSSLYVCHTGVPQPRWLELESRLNERAVSLSDQETRWGVSALVAGGLIIRGLAREAHQLSTGLFQFWDQAKRELWSLPAIAPRKIN